MSYREIKLESHRQPSLIITPVQAAEYEATQRRAYEHASGIVERAKTGELYYPSTAEQGDVVAKNDPAISVEDNSVMQDWRAARQRRQAQEQALLEDRRAQVSLQVGATAVHP